MINLSFSFYRLPNQKANGIEKGVLTYDDETIY